LFLFQSFLSKLDTDDGLVEPTNPGMGSPCDGWTAETKEGRRVSLSYTTETDPTVHSLIFGWAGEVGYLSFRAQKNGQLSTEERDRK
jgi:hypothetical protein